MNKELPVSDTRKAAFSITKIFLPIDFSASSEAVLEAGSGLALQFDAGIHLVHIIAEIPDFNGSDFFPETTVLQERKDHRREARCLQRAAGAQRNSDVLQHRDQQ